MPARAHRGPALEDVERRLLGLWGLSTVLLLALTCTVLSLTAWAPGALHRALDHIGTRSAVGSLIAGFCAYSLAQERRMRRLLRDALEERVREDGRRHHAELTHRATHDVLTGLPNRALLEQRVEEALATDAGGALLFVDLDDFKLVNDRYGHAVGDGLLAAVSGRVVGALPRRDVPARIGGDEFAILLSGVHDAEVALGVADRLLHVVAAPFRVDGVVVTVTASVGVALLGVHGQDYRRLIQAADVALYRAKRAGRARSRLAEPEGDVRAAG